MLPQRVIFAYTFGKSVCQGWEFFNVFCKTIKNDHIEVDILFEQTAITQHQCHEANSCTTSSRKLSRLNGICLLMAKAVSAARALAP